MTVEAALAVPFFLFFIMNILVIFDMLRLHGNIEEAIHQTGNQMAFCGYAYKNVEELGFSLPDEMSSIAMSEVYARGRVIRILGTDYLNNTCLSSGAAGLHFVKSSVMKEDDVIDFIVSYKVKPLIGIIGFADFPMENRYYGRAWTGYDVENGQGGQEDDPIVFIAENGVVYHTSRNCTYLCPSINMISAFQKDNIRNEQGEKYHACERCGRAGIQGVLYITSQGNRYHNSLKCSGLKRTIYAVHLSETGGKGKCSKCG
ncbi:hypothetical protein [Kineothrix alysoides]|nr:hypothetical protein [Kineothrix alysoides]